MPGHCAEQEKKQAPESQDSLEIKRLRLAAGAQIVAPAGPAGADSGSDQASTRLYNDAIIVRDFPKFVTSSAEWVKARHRACRH